MNITCVRENVIHDFNSRLEKRKKMEQRKREKVGPNWSRSRPTWQIYHLIQGAHKWMLITVSPKICKKLWRTVSYILIRKTTLKTLTFYQLPLSRGYTWFLHYCCLRGSIKLKKPSQKICKAQ